MLGRCANPACLEPFRRLDDGKLFRVESDPYRAAGEKPEYFWLCRGCASEMTLSLDEDAGVKIRPFPDTSDSSTHIGDFIPRDRKKGRLLTSVPLS